MDKYYQIQREYIKAHQTGNEEAMNKCLRKLADIGQLENTKHKLEKYKVA